jgi:5,10-methylenetetrahydromethanopterin reductase
MPGRPSISVRAHGGMSAAACVEIAETAERWDFATLWFAENMFDRGIWPALTASALATKRLKLGPGVFNPYNRHPTLIAMEMAAFDELCGGRAVLGLGSGTAEAVQRMGLAYKPLPALRDACHIVRGLLTDGAVTYAGSVFSAHEVRLNFKPRRALPIHLAAMGDRVLELAGELADGLMVSNLCPAGFTAWCRDLVVKGAARAVRPAPSAVVHYVPCLARPDRREAIDGIKLFIGRMMVGYWKIAESAPIMRRGFLLGSGIPEMETAAAIEKLQAGAAAADVLDDRYVDAYAIAGSADDCLAAIDRFAAVGVTELVLTFTGTQPATDMAYLGDAIRASRQ